MTDRVRTLTVILEQDTRDDDAEEIAALLRCVRGVARVELGSVVDHQEMLVRDMFRRKLGKHILDLIYGKEGDRSVREGNGGTE